MAADIFYHLSATWGTQKTRLIPHQTNDDNNQWQSIDLQQCCLQLKTTSGWAAAEFLTALAINMALHHTDVPGAAVYMCHCIIIQKAHRINCHHAIRNRHGSLSQRPFRHTSYMACHKDTINKLQLQQQNTEPNGRSGIHYTSLCPRLCQGLSKRCCFEQTSDTANHSVTNTATERYSMVHEWPASTSALHTYAAV
eukprot:GHUV01030151.1.p2 GENE.GHUV01030151.1~~GHUV01030151.1.p2  ORF type:complete len:196 (-),score=48.79 GHUV01030151.1:2265-2852(-)